MNLQHKLSLTCIVLLLISFLIIRYRHSTPQTGTAGDISDILLDATGITPASILSFKPVQIRSCRFDGCFDITRCEFNRDSLIKVYTYPSLQFHFETDGARTNLRFNTSLPYKGILTAIESSPFYTEDPSKACVFIPPIDTLSHSTNCPVLSSLALSQLPFWNGGGNHLVFSLLPSLPNSLPALSTQRAAVAGAGLSYSQYRTGFDLSIPVFNFPERLPALPTRPADTDRDLFLLILLPLELDTSLEATLEELQARAPGRVVALDFCYEGERCAGEETADFPGILLRARFCLLVTGYRHATPDLLDVLMHGCVPVYLSGTHMLPFEEVLDWSLMGVPVRPAFLSQTLSILDSLGPEEWRRKQSHSLRIWSRHFSSLGRLSLTALLVLNERVFSAQATSHEDWNALERGKRRENPLLMLPTPARDAGLTAVVVSHGGGPLTDLVRTLVSVRSVRRVLVLWRSQKAAIPTFSESDTPVQIVQSEGNRFPRPEHVEGDCVLSLSDDVTHLSPEEVELGYRAWRQFPDRLLGFSAASHLWNEVRKRWEFVGEEGEEFSLLTGPLLYHSYYLTRLTEYAPDLMDLDDRCEDLILNFLVSILTNKLPIKLAQKTDLCRNCEESRVEVRSECLNKLFNYFGRMPLRPARFRADPIPHSVDLPP